MEKFWVGEELCFVRGPDDFEALVRAHMGDDAADYARGLSDIPDCGGECDNLYEQQEQYEEAIRDALEYLRGISVTKSYRHDLDRAITILEVELE